MKITYRTKYQAITAINKGFEFLVIRRFNSFYYAMLSDIAVAPVGSDSKEYEALLLVPMNTSCDITYRDMMSL